MTNHEYVGRSVPRLDAPEKTAGGATYTLDLQLPKMLHGKLKTSPFPHARILGIDASRAERLPSVRLVLTAKDILDQVIWGVMPGYYNQRPPPC